MSWLQRIGALLRGNPLPAPPYRGGSTYRLLPGGGRLDTDPRDTKHEQASSYNGWVYAAVSTIAADIAATPLRLWRKAGQSRDDWEPVELPAALARPNDTDTLEDLLELVSITLDLTGEAYPYMVGDDRRLDGLQIILPQWVQEPMLGPTTAIESWRVEVPGRGSQYIPATEFARITYPSPFDPWRGMSPVQAFALSYDAELYARAYAANLYKNRAVPDLVITTDQMLTTEAADLIRERWRDRYQGIPGEVGVLGAGSSVTPLQMPLQDLAFLDMANLSRDQILAIYKVPRFLMGDDSDSGARANGAELVSNYQRNALLPRMRRIARALNTHVLPRMVGRDQAAQHALEFDSPVEEDDTEQAQRSLHGLQEGAVTVDEYRAMAGLPPLPDGRGDVLLVPSNKVPVLDPRAVPAATAPQAPPRAAPSLPTGVSMERREVSALRWLSRQGPRERRLQGEVRKLFQRQARLVVDNFARGGADWAEQRDYLSDALRSTRPDWTAVLQEVGILALRDGWELTLDDLTLGGSDAMAWDVYQQAAVDQAAARAGAAIVQIEATTRTAVRATVAQAVEEGLSNQQTARALRELYDGFAGRRAEVIARTETAGSVNTGKHAAARQAEDGLGLTVTRTWSATNDGRTRDSHTAADGQQVEGTSAVWQLAGGTVRYPADPQGPARETIQCRCVEVMTAQ